jgi:hypothetical protein
MLRTLPGGPAHLPPWVQVPGALHLQDLKLPLGAGTQQLLGHRDQKMASGSWDSAVVWPTGLEMGSRN